MFSTPNTDMQNVLLLLWLSEFSCVQDITAKKMTCSLQFVQCTKYSMCVNLKRDICLFFPPPLEERQKKKRQHREKSSEEGKTSLKRSKTFVNLLFKKDRKERSRSKSPSHRANKGERAVTGCGFSFTQCSLQSEMLLQVLNKLWNMTQRSLN